MNERRRVWADDTSADIIVVMPRYDSDGHQPGRHVLMLMDRTLDELDTPRVLVDLDLLESNIQRMAKFAADHGVNLRAATGTWQEVEPA